MSKYSVLLRIKWILKTLILRNIFYQKSKGMNDITLQEVLEIKARKSQVTKDMTTEQLNEYYADSLQEFCKIAGKQLKNEAQGYIHGTEYYRNLDSNDSTVVMNTK